MNIANYVELVFINSRRGESQRERVIKAEEGRVVSGNKSEVC